MEEVYMSWNGHWCIKKGSTVAQLEVFFSNPQLGDRKSDRQPRTLLDAHTYSHMHADSQTDRMTLPFEFTALVWSKSLPPAFFVLTS